MIEDTTVERIKRTCVTVCVTLAIACVWVFGVGAVFLFVLEISDPGQIRLAMILSTIPFSIYLAPKVWQATASHADSVMTE